jgi:hypothetical protein
MFLHLIPAWVIPEHWTDVVDVLIAGKTSSLEQDVNEIDAVARIINNNNFFIAVFLCFKFYYRVNIWLLPVNQKCFRKKFQH